MPVKEDANFYNGNVKIVVRRMPHRESPKSPGWINQQRLFEEGSLHNAFVSVLRPWVQDPWIMDLAFNLAALNRQALNAGPGRRRG